MQIVKKAEELSRICREWHKAGETVSLVPPMGYYHAGHESLMDRARELGTKLVVSLFVNPTQFGPNEDYGAYPRDLDRDSKIAEKHNVDVLFAPEPSEMYAPDASSGVEGPEMSKVLCGFSRPIHFRGVYTVCTKLFMLTQADYACFGEKDWQQQAILRRMVRDLDFPVHIHGAEIVRHGNGLAYSSRNARLTAEQKEQAVVIRKAMLQARDEFRAGTDVRTVKEHAAAMIGAVPGTRIDYLEIVDAETMQPLEEIRNPALMAAAVYLGDVRLIDNIEL